jgi:hypothetical protein
MAGTVAALVQAARREWNHWGQSTWNVPTGQFTLGHRDDDPVLAQYVIDNYCSVGGGSPTVLEIQDDAFAWSAVGMSAIVKSAGYTKAEFPFSIRHSTWIRRFVRARKEADASAAFWGYRQGEAGGEPAVGDLVAYARGPGMNAAKAAALFDANHSYASHTDLVVARNATSIEVIGANVRDSVTLKRLRLHPTGHIDDSKHHWFAVLKRR